jgi:S-adenosylhomocysteine hydrolase
MPALAAVVARRARARPLADVSVLLVHHTTAEVLGLIAALRQLGCPDLDVLFVRYAGEMPTDLVEAVVDEPGVRSTALRRVRDPGEIEGHFVLSRQFSALDELAPVATRLREAPTRFFDAMCATGVHLALRQLVRARRARRRMLVVEDGGYVVPLLARHALAGATVGALADAYGVTDVSRDLRRRSLASVLDETLLGSVEHTRNGFDRLNEIVREHGRLARPAYSIAISTLKRGDEAREVASGVLAAVEAVYHATGRVLGARHPLVIGSRGAIGASLVQALVGRVHAPVLGLDLAAPRRTRIEATAWAELPAAARRAVDLVIGATGVSVLGAREAEELLLHGRAPTVTFASASTKTVEFRDVAAWIEGLLASAAPRIGGRRVQILPEEILDPQSGRLYGMEFRFRFLGSRPAEKRFVFLANLTPVNFLFYGVPAEVMDRVMAQLARTTLALVRTLRRRPSLPPQLYAVDRDLADAALG